MAIRTGIDIVNVERIQRSIEKDSERFLNRVFTSAEIECCEKKATKYQSYAARFAAKEALFKALSTASTILALKDIEIINGESGQPSYQLDQKHLNQFQIKSENISLSLSHEEQFAVAIAIIQD